MNIISSAFKDGDKLPSKYTCDGEDVNPPFQFIDIPKGTKSLILLMDDPDVPKNIKPDGIFDHWVVYNIPPTCTDVAENCVPLGNVGLNTVGDNTYTGACPPDREHRYFFKLYALDCILTIPENSATKHAVITAMQGHIISQAELMGKYERKAHV